MLLQSCNISTRVTTTRLEELSMHSVNSANGLIIYLISLLVIGSAIAWSLKKAPSDTELWGEDEQEKE